MRADSPNWVELGAPASPAEREALNKVRDLLEDDGLTRAWANLTFIDRNGRLGEIDVLLLTRRGFYVVELKGWHGRLTGNQQTWHLENPGGTRSAKNPYHLTDNKAKRLSSLLREISPHAHLPFVGALVVLHGRDSVVALDDLGATGVVRLDGFNVRGSLQMFSEFLRDYPLNPKHRIDLPTANAVKGACDKAGFKATPKQRRVGQYDIEQSDPIATGPDWQDFVVKHPALGDQRRLRLYDVPPQASKDDRTRIEQAARRELRLTQAIKHEGIESPLDMLTTDSGPALLFPFDGDALPLDEYLRRNASVLTFDDRVALVRQVGEILRYAHNRRLVHRALAPQRVWVTKDGDAVRLSIRDWYAGQRSRSTAGATTSTVLSQGVADVRDAVAPEDWFYLAPESLRGGADMPSIPLDVYGVGAIAYLVLTGQPPAASLPELEQKFRLGYLDPSAASAAVPDAYADVVRDATATVESERTPSIGEFLDRLERAARAERDAAEQEQTSPIDPVDAQAGDVLADRFIVESRRGEGSTGTALLVDDTAADDDKPVILKIGRNESAARRLTIEADVLRSLDSPRVVRLLDGPVKLDAGRVGLVLSDAGKDTLADRISQEGRATIEQLEGYGRDLLEAVAHLDERGVFHRDIKPANLGIAPDPGTRKPRLTLFDLSLAHEPLENITSGTTGYKDPYLGRGARRQYDRAAELWAVAVTLFEMATRSLPWWPDGGEAPLTAGEVPVIAATSFETSIAEPMVAFFRRALAPQAKDRFTHVADLADAWLAAFATLDAVDADAEADDVAAGRATLTTPLTEAGFSARALSGLGRLEALTVGDLLGTPPTQVNSIPGLGEKHRKEVQKRIREWRVRLSTPTTVDDVEAGRGIEGIVKSLLALPKSSAADEPVLNAILGLGPTPVVEPVETTPQIPWPTVADAATTAGIDRADAYRAIDRAIKRWTKRDAVQMATQHLLDVLTAEGRVMALPEAAAALASKEGSQLEGTERLRYSAALIRALVEVEEQTDEPRLTVRRRTDGAPIVACTEVAGLDETGVAGPPADLLTDLAAALGRRADDLVRDGVVVPAQARTALRELLAAGIDISDERLVRLAAATSKQASVSSLGELYPTSLPIADAIDHALRGRPGQFLNEMMVRRRVFARFPDLKGTVPDHPKLDELVAKPLPGMSWDGTQYALKDSTAASRGSTHLTSFAGVQRSEVDRSLLASLRMNSAVVLGVVPQRYQQAATALSSLYGVDVMDVSRMVIQAARTLAEADEVPWDVVLDADAADRSSGDWQNLTELVREAITPMWRHVTQATRPLLIVNAGPLVRYGMSDALSDLLDVGTPRPAARWLLVARDKSTPVPMLEGKPVPLGPSPVLDLPYDLDLVSAVEGPAR